MALALFAIFGLASPGGAVSYQDATGAPVKAAFAEGRLWVLSDKGVLTSFAETDAAPRVEIAEDVLRFCILDGAPLAVLGKYKIERAWRLRRHGAEGWTDFATVRVGQEHLNAVGCDGGAVILFAAKRNIRVDAAGQRSTNFKFVRGAREAGERLEYVGLPPMKTVGGYGATFALPGVVAIRGGGGPILLAPR